MKAIKKNLLTPTLTRLLGAAALVIGVGVAANNSPCADAAAPEAVAPLLVGITPEYPPLVFRQPDGTNGVEIDFAHALGRELQRPVEFVVLRRDQLIDALRDRKIDIIMSGMSVTKARRLRVAFTEPYLRNELRAIFPLKQAASFQSPADILKTDAKIGVVPGTTAEVFVKQNCTNAQIVSIGVRTEVAVHLLKTKRMDVFVDDVFALAEIVSKNEADISYLKTPLSEEDLAWGIRPEDRAFLARVNEILAKWKTDGTKDEVLHRLMPYLSNR